MPKRRLKVFISYARSDQEKALDLYNRLISDGLDAWIDKENLLPGQDWELEIRKFIREADVVMVCLSKNFNKAGFRQKEVHLALDVALEKPDGEIFIIPARLEECENLESLRKWNWVDLFGDGGYENLMQALCQRAGEIGASIPQLPTNGNFKINQPNVEKKTIKKSSKPKKVSQPGDFSKIEVGNRSIVIVGNVTGSNLITGNENKTEPSGNSLGSSETKVEILLRSEKLVSDRVLESWLNRHGLAKNPFGKVDFRSHPYYPEGSIRPNQWEAFLDPDPLFGLCPTSEDAQVLSHRLRMECLPLKNKDRVGEVNHRIFPIWVSHRKTAPVQPPLITFAQSAAQTWLDILLQDPDQFFQLSSAKQDALLDLLHWYFGTANEIISLLQVNGLEEDVIGLSLIRRVEKFRKEFSTSPVPQDAILLSWLNIKPLDLKQKILIIPGDDFFLATPKWWFEHFSSLLSSLFNHGIITKVISSTRLQVSLPFQEIELSWSDGLNGWLHRSLQGQFDSAMASEAKSLGIAVRFHELFGPGVTEEQTTANLISASRKSLARMLTFGNRLLQYHCGKRGVSEKYLYVEDLEAILKIA